MIGKAHLKFLNFTSDCFIAPMIIIVKKDDSLKLALGAKLIDRQLLTTMYQMPSVDELLDAIIQNVTSNAFGTL